MAKKIRYGREASGLSGADSSAVGSVAMVSKGSGATMRLF